MATRFEAGRLQEGEGRWMERRSKKKRNKRSSSYHQLGFSCFRSDDRKSSTEVSDGRDQGVDMAAGSSSEYRRHDHLVIMINGLTGSARDWRYAAKQFLKRFPQDVVVHCSRCNPGRRTFDGVDVMGDRVAEEVISVVKCHPDVRKISFIGHSLGGLVARYAIAKLYAEDQTRERFQRNEDGIGDGSNDSYHKMRPKGKIAGLEPMNYVSCATPHLGSRGHKQVPAFCGLYSLEQLATYASSVLGRTGKHLFLTDSDGSKSPILLQMVKDCEGLKFISALQSFRRRVAYANIQFDLLVGWSTSSLRRRSELPKRKQLSRHQKYPHIVNVEGARSVGSSQNGNTEAAVDEHKTIGKEEEMIRNLDKLRWERVDVKFNGGTKRLIAHNNIQVNRYWLNSDGADVVSHMIDNFLL